MKRVLFICGRNRLRSPTAEQLFATWPDLEVSSAGPNPDADTPLTAEMVEEADLVFVMERAQKAKLSKRFGAWLTRSRAICLDIPDNYAFMDPALISLLRTKVTPFLR